MNEIQLDKLSRPVIVEIPTQEEILAITNPDNLPAADPEGRQIRNSAAREVYIHQQRQKDAESLLLAFASGKNLDFIGETYYRDSEGKPIKRKLGQSDEEYRIDLQESPEGLTSAGTVSSYEYHARRSHPVLKKRDVNARSPAPMEMNVYYLTTDELAQEVEQAIIERLKKFCPGGDLVRVIRGLVKVGTITGTVKCKRGVGLEITKADGRKRLDDYLLQARALGGIISKSSIDAALTVEGVEQISLNEWTDIECEHNEYPEITAITLNYEERL